MNRNAERPTICSRWMIHTYTNNPFIIVVRDMMYEYWKNENEMINYYIFHMVKDKYPDIWEAIPTFNNISPHTLQFELMTDYNKERFEQIIRMSDFHKLNRRIADSYLGGVKRKTFINILLISMVNKHCFVWLYMNKFEIYLIYTFVTCRF